MNPKFFPLALLSCALCLAPALAQDGSPTLNEAAPPAPRVAADAFVWRFAPPLGSGWQIRSFVRTETKNLPSPNGVPAKRKETVNLRNVIADYDVLSRDQFGATTSRITLRNVVVSATGTVNGQKISSSEDRSEAVRRALQGANFTIKQAPTGAIWGIANTDAIANRIATAIAPFEPLDLAPEALAARAQTMTNSLVGPDALRLLLGLGNAPAYPVVTSENWAYAVALPTGFRTDFELKGAQTLNRLTPELVFIGSNATYDPANAPRVPSDNNETIKAAVRGASRVARDSGLTLEATSSWRISKATDEATIEVHTLLVPR